MVDEPGPFDTLETWEQFLTEMESLPNFMFKPEIVQQAKEMIAEKKQERNERP